MSSPDEPYNSLPGMIINTATGKNKGRTSLSGRHFTVISPSFHHNL